MTIRINPQTTSEILAGAKKVGVIAGKLYPDGVTTGSAGGVRDFKALYDVFAAMRDLEMVLSIHGEAPGVNWLEAEEKFILILQEIIRDFPGLKIVAEHLTTKAMVDFLLEPSIPDTVGATITAHHPVLTHDRVYLGRIICWPHNYCKPVAKTKQDQEVLVRMILSGNPRFWFGSDAAPHPVSKKECDDPAAGVFAPGRIALAILTQIFEDANRLERLESFVSQFGAEFYGVPLNEGTITLTREAWFVPKRVASVVPFLAGQKLAWRIID